MQEQSNYQCLLETHQSTEGLFGKLPPGVTKQMASDLLDLSIAEYHYREAIQSVARQILGDPHHE